jgi:hypothetical protein
MQKPNPWISLAILASAAAFTTGASAHSVVYTLRTVTDGRLGNHPFSQAVVVIRMKADTATVQRQISSSGGIVFKNAVGTTTVSITEGRHTTVATFAPGEIYVRYDQTAGIAGFGSAISRTYPFALGCDNYAYPSDSLYSEDCTQGDWGPIAPFDDQALASDGIANVRAEVAAGSYLPSVFSTQVLALPTNLSHSTLLTGRIHACATTYSVGEDYGGWGDLQACSAAAPRGLRTNHGGFYVQDKIGGTVSNGPFFWNSWYLANGGSLQVEVFDEEERGE